MYSNISNSLALLLQSVVFINVACFFDYLPAESTARADPKVAEKQFLQKHKPMLQPMESGMFPELYNRTVLIYLKDIYPSKLEDFLKSSQANELLARLNAGMPPSKSVMEKLHASGSNQKELNSRLIKKAQDIHLYAERDRKSPQFPFEIHQWANLGSDPTTRQLWESQMQIWVINTIASVIAKTNQTNVRTQNVTLSPVKKLIKLRVVEGYIKGASREGILGNPKTIYDVKHAYLTVIVDRKLFPNFKKSLNEHSLLTVRSEKIKEVAEAVGSLYGHGVDCIEVQLFIESKWAREWVKPLMPTAIRKRLENQ